MIAIVLSLVSIAAVSIIHARRAHKNAVASQAAFEASHPIAYTEAQRKIAVKQRRRLHLTFRHP